MRLPTPPFCRGLRPLTNTLFLGPKESSLQTGPRSVQPFLHTKVKQCDRQEHQYVMHSTHPNNSFFLALNPKKAANLNYYTQWV